MMMIMMKMMMIIIMMMIMMMMMIIMMMMMIAMMIMMMIVMIIIHSKLADLTTSYSKFSRIEKNISNTFVIVYTNIITIYETITVFTNNYL